MTRRVLLERLLAAVRAEFRAEVLVFDVDDPVFGTRSCRISSCQRAARGHGLCQGHHLRWVSEGRPDLDGFAASTDPRWRRQLPNTACRLAGCGYGVARHGLCQLHYQRWDRASRPELAGWSGGQPTVTGPRPDAVCRVEGCWLWPEGTGPFCHAHTASWRRRGRPDMDAFAATFTEVANTEEQTVRLERLGPQLRLELQYALQCRRDHPSTQTRPEVVTALVKRLRAAGVDSLLERTEAQWRSEITHSTARPLLIDARRQVADLAEADGWEAEFDRDTWQMRRLGFAGNQQLRFAPISQPWSLLRYRGDGVRRMIAGGGRLGIVLGESVGDGP